MIGISGAALLMCFFMKEVAFGTTTDENYGLVDGKRRIGTDEEKDEGDAREMQMIENAS